MSACQLEEGITKVFQYISGVKDFGLHLPGCKLTHGLERLTVDWRLRRAALALTARVEVGGVS